MLVEERQVPRERVVACLGTLWNWFCHILMVSHSAEGIWPRLCPTFQ